LQIHILHMSYDVCRVVCVMPHVLCHMCVALCFRIQGPRRIKLSKQTETIPKETIQYATNTKDLPDEIFEICPHTRKGDKNWHLKSKDTRDVQDTNKVNFQKHELSATTTVTVEQMKS